MTKPTPSSDIFRYRLIPPGHRRADCPLRRAPKQRKPRQPRLDAAIEAAEKIGKKVSGATVRADGSVTLRFGEASPAKHNSWDDLETQ
jgi:hypothetical protein